MISRHASAIIYDVFLIILMRRFIVWSTCIHLWIILYSIPLWQRKKEIEAVRVDIREGKRQQLTRLRIFNLVKFWEVRRNSDTPVGVVMHRPDYGVRRAMKPILYNIEIPLDCQGYWFPLLLFPSPPSLCAMVKPVRSKEGYQLRNS